MRIDDVGPIASVVLNRLYELLASSRQVTWDELVGILPVEITTDDLVLTLERLRDADLIVILAETLDDEVPFDLFRSSVSGMSLMFPQWPDSDSSRARTFLDALAAAAESSAVEPSEQTKVRKLLAAAGEISQETISKIVAEIATRAV